MTSQQYEELCRFFIADQLHLDIAQVVSRTIANPRREPGPDGIDHEPYTHQIDLYWETGGGLAQYVNIANAKWRDHDKVRQHEVLLLQKVREKIGAHKAFMITNSGFTGCAQQVAEDEGIGLIIVRPRFGSRGMHRTRRSLILEHIQHLAQKGRPVYLHEVLRKNMASVLESTQSPRLITAFRHTSFGKLADDHPRFPSLLDHFATRQGGGPGYQTK